MGKTIRFNAKHVTKASKTPRSKRHNKTEQLEHNMKHPDLSKRKMHGKFDHGRIWALPNEARNKKGRQKI